VVPVSATPLAFVDLGASGPADPGERQREAWRRVEELARKPFDLSSGPLLRALLIRLDDEAHLLVMVLHHIAGDGWSWGILLRELDALCGAGRGGEPSPLPDLPVQYLDFAVWQRHRVQGPALDGELAYWKRQLGRPWPVLALPSARPRPPRTSDRGALLTLWLPPGLTRALHALGRQEGVTLFMILLAALDVLLCRCTGQEDIVVATWTAGRDRREIEGLIGCFVNTLLLRTDLRGRPPFRGLLARVREVCLGGYAHQELPFERLREELAPRWRGELGRAPFRVMLVLQNASRPPRELPGLRLTWLPVDTATSRFDLTLSVVERPEGLKVTFEYRTDVLEEAAVSWLARGLEVLLPAVVADPDIAIWRIPLPPLGADNHQAQQGAEP
jgi:hypothetical protein